MHSYSPKNDTINLRIAQDNLETVTTHQLIVPEMGTTQEPPIIYQIFITKFHLLIEKYKSIKVLNQFQGIKALSHLTHNDSFVSGHPRSSKHPIIRIGIGVPDFAFDFAKLSFWR